MRFAPRLALLAAALALVAVLAVALLAARSTDRTLSGLAEARITLVLTSLALSIQVNLDLGLPLADLRSIEDLIERKLSAEPDLRAIEVIDAFGRALFSTDRGAVGELVPASWQAALSERRSAATWRAVDRGEVVIGLPIENSIGLTVGYVAVVVPVDQLEREGSEPLLLALGALPIAFGAALVAGLLVWAVAYRRQRAYRALAAAVAADALPAADGDPLLAALVQARDACRQSERAVAAARAELERVDDGL